MKTFLSVATAVAVSLIAASCGAPQINYPKPLFESFSYSGDSIHESFEAKTLDSMWVAPCRSEEVNVADADAAAPWYKLIAGCLQLEPRQARLSVKDDPSMLCVAADSSEFVIQSRLLYTPTETQSLAGMIIYCGEHEYIGIGKQLSAGGQLEVTVFRSGGKESEVIIAHHDIADKLNHAPLDMRAEVSGQTVSFSYSIGESTVFSPLGDAVALDFSLPSAKDSVPSAMVGLFAIKH